MGSACVFHFNEDNIKMLERPLLMTQCLFPLSMAQRL